MSKTRTLTDRTLANRHVADVLDEQTMNLTQQFRGEGGAYKKVYGMLTKVARHAIRCVLAKPVGKPNMTRKNWHQDFANACERAMIAAGFEKAVEGYVKEFMRTLPKAVGTRAETKWSYFKIATYAGQCATMLHHRLNPDLLTETDEEYMAHVDRIIEVAKGAGIPTAVVILPSNPQ